METPPPSPKLYYCPPTLRLLLSACFVRRHQYPEDPWLDIGQWDEFWHAAARRLAAITMVEVYETAGNVRARLRSAGHNALGFYRRCDQRHGSVSPEDYWQALFWAECAGFEMDLCDKADREARAILERQFLKRLDDAESKRWLWTAVYGDGEPLAA